MKTDLLVPKILISLSIAILTAGVYDNAQSGWRAGGGADIWAGLAVIEFFFLVQIVLFFRKLNATPTEAETKNFKRTSLWMLLPVGLMIPTGIGLIAFFSTILSLTTVFVLCLWSVSLISKNNVVTLSDADNS